MASNDRNYSLFRKTTPDWVKLAGVTLVAVLMLYYNGPKLLREGISFALITPIQTTVHIAKNAFKDAFFHSYRVQTLAHQNQALREENQRLAMQVQTASRFEQDSIALHAQFNLPVPASTPLVYAESLYQVVDPYMRKLVLNKGEQHGVALGQPVINAEGLMGQITDVKTNSSELTLITDTKVNIPVMSARNPNVRGFISGHKREGLLEIRLFNADGVDLQVGDLLVTSGLDGLFPPNLKVAKVTQIHPPGHDGRSELTIEPISHMLSVRYVAIMQLDHIDERRVRSDEQANRARDNAIPSTLGERTREQFRTR